MKNILITGGAGFIGSHLVDGLLAEGCRVSVIDDLSTGHLSNLEHVFEQITFYRGDIRDQDLLIKATKGCDTVFHHAAMISVPRTVEQPVEAAMINDIGTLLVLETARNAGVKRVVLASSCAVYGDDPVLPKHEDLDPKPQSPYAVQKLTGEFNATLYDALYGLETVSLRYFNVFGPRQDPSSPYSGVISIFINKAMEKKAAVIYGDGNQYRDFIFVKDVVKANLFAAKRDEAIGQIFNIGAGSFIRINQLWEMICDISGRTIDPVFEPSRPGDILESVANIDRAKSVLGFEPEYEFLQGLKATFDWYKGSRPN